MTARKPIVLVSGQPQELPAGDSIYFGDGASFPRNLIINPFLDFCQRGARNATTGYFYDRWIQSSGVTNPAWTADISMDNSMKLNASGDNIEQRVKRLDMRRAWYAAKKVTVSAYYDCSTAGNISVILAYPTSVDNYTSTTNITTDTFSLSTGTGRIQRTITLPDNAYTNGLSMKIQSAGAIVKLGGFRVEPGTSAANHELYFSEDDYKRCLQHYEKSFYKSQTPASAVGINTGESTVWAISAGVYSARFLIDFIGAKFSDNPSITFFNPNASGSQARNQGSSTDCTSTVVTSVSNKSAIFTTSTPSNTTVTARIGVHWTAEDEL